MHNSRFLKSSMDDHGLKLDETTVTLMAGFSKSAAHPSNVRPLSSKPRM